MARKRKGETIPTDWTPSVSVGLDWLPPKFIPTPKQLEFFRNEAFEVLFGGAAGGGKTLALIVAALRYVRDSNYRALLLRRTYPQSIQLRESAMDIYSRLGAEYNSVEKTFRFPSGASIRVGSLEHDTDVYNYQGAAYQYVGFDEATQFTQKQYTYLFTRCRSAHGIKSFVRGATNPGGVTHEFFLERFSPWLRDQIPPGSVLHVSSPDGKEVFAAGGSEDSLSRAAIPAKLEDNPYLAQADPTYKARLKSQDFVTREQLLHGNWLVQAAKGLYFKRAWFKMEDRSGLRGSVVRAWDFASTVDGDWTVACKMRRDPTGKFQIEDLLRMRGTPIQVEEAIKRTAAHDGQEVAIAVPEDPGQAGKFQAQHLARMLAGFNIRSYRPTKDKVYYARPLSAQVEAGNVSVTKAGWNDVLLDELEQFPEGTFDDQVDACSLAFRSLVSTGEFRFTDAWDGKGPDRVFVDNDDNWARDWS